MLQRLALVVGVVVIDLLAPALAHAGERCGPPDQAGNVTCDVGVPSERLEAITSQQKMSQWCWAASISMIFGYHGHPVSQERIVQAVWGQLADMPAMSGSMMSESLARPWRDDRGRPFQARVRVFDVDAGQYGLDDQTIIGELRAERPLLVGTAGHAMVMTAMRYVRSRSGQVQIVGATVRDPWPGRGRRELEWSEMQPQYVAAVDIAGGPARAPDVSQAPKAPTEPPDRIADDQPSPARAACEARCSSEMRACQGAVPRVESCLQEAVESCVGSCVEDYRQPAWTCRTQLCDPRNGPNYAWRAECQSERDQALASCADDGDQCRELCL